jgi:uncharacterized protein (DUF1800 family)
MKISLRKSSYFLLLLAVFASFIHAQSDPNPDSPTPILLSETDKSRLLAVDSEKWNGELPKVNQKVFRPTRKTTLTLFVTNLDLIEGEGANAVRVYLKQKSGKTFLLQTENLEPINKTVYALKVRLFDTQNLYSQPTADGDSLVYLTWRGIASNYLKIGLGKTGGDIKIPSERFSELTKTSAQTSDFAGYRYSGDRIRFLEQATFGATTELDNRIRRIGLRTWLAEQFDAPYPTIAMPNPLQKPTIIPTDCQLVINPTCFREHYTMTPLQQWFFKEAFYGNAPLRHRVAWSLSQIWVTSGVTVQQSSHQIAFHKILANNAFGNYRQLMQEATLSPTMGVYLDMVRSTKNNPNENYPREILQLFSVGLYLLNQDGTLQLDAQNNPIPTYSQETVNNLSKVFTGWTYCNSTCANSVPGVLNYKDPMILAPANHDTTAKTLLNYPNAINPTISACADCSTNEATQIYAEDSLNRTLDNIFYHPNVAPYIGKLLIQQLITSDPSPAYIGRVSAVFNNNGAGIRGDLKAVIRAILLDPEARGNLKTAPRYGKLREPAQMITNLARNFPAKSWNGETQSDGGLSFSMIKMGQNPFNSPTVFNYYPPDYIVPGTTILAPEFALLNTAAAISRTNFLYLLLFEGITPNATDAFRGTSLDLSEMTPFSEADASGNQLLDALNNKMMHGALSPEHRASILTAVQAVPNDNPLLRVKTAVYLIAASSQYQIQR